MLFSKKGKSKIHLPLVEAMRRGIELSNPTTGGLYSEDYDGTKHSCALGAAGVGVEMKEINYKTLLDEWPVLANGMSSLCGCLFVNGASLYKQIFHMNDSHQWKREDIANIVEARLKGEKIDLPKDTVDPQEFSYVPIKYYQSIYQQTNATVASQLVASYYEYATYLSNPITYEIPDLPKPQPPPKDEASDEFNAVATAAAETLAEV